MSARSYRADRLAAMALALAVCGCGFAPQDDFTGRRVGDGISPWTDLGSLRLCAGNQLIGPPASDPGGLCTAPAQVRPPCTSDSECASRERCVCGGCTVQYCTSNADCTGGQVCTFGSVNGNRCDTPCTRNDDCAAGEVCQEPRCVKRCETDAECQSGEFCATLGLRKLCAVKPCTGDDECVSGDICRIQRVPRVATEPTALRDGDAYVMWLELSDEIQQDQRAIYRAVSDDGINYRLEPAAPVVEDGGAAHAPSVVRTPTGFALYYEAGDGESIKRTESADGQNFGAASVEIPAGSSAVRAPGAVSLPDGRVELYYQVGDGDAIALSGAGNVLTPTDVTDPPTRDRDQFWIAIEAVGSPYAALATDQDGEPIVRLWFTAFGQESDDSLRLGEVVPTAPNYSLGYAAAPAAAPAELTVWPFNPIFDRISVFVDHLSELAPAVVPAGPEAFLLYYLAADPDATQIEALGVARSGE